jgi:hypothetical protein
VGEAVPLVLVLRDLGDLLGLGTSRTFELYQAGAFDRFELLPRLGNRPRFSGAKVQTWLAGEAAAPDSRFANARARRRAALRGGQ